MNSKQMIVGNATEGYVAQYFHSKGYWAYILPKKIGGQPFDIIACKENKTWFIDAKHLEAYKVSFTLDRIESNQITSMRYARNFAKIKNLGFIIQWDACPETLYYLSYDKLLELERNGAKSVKIATLDNMENLI